MIPPVSCIWIRKDRLAAWSTKFPQNLVYINQSLQISKPMYCIYLPPGYLTVCHGKSPFLIGKPSINGPFSPWLGKITRL